MPVYQFYCSDCRTSFEVLRSMADADAPPQCSSCGGSHHVNRTITTFSVLTGKHNDAIPRPESSASFDGGGGCCGGACGCGR